MKYIKKGGFKKKKFIICFIAFVMIFTTVTPFSAFASTTTDEENRNYTEYVEIEGNGISTFSNDETEEVLVPIENAVVENTAEERTVTTIDSDQNEIVVHYDKETDELTITSDGYTEEELQQAEQMAREMEVIFEDEETVFENEIATMSATSWKYTSTVKGNTRILKNSLTLIQVGLAGFLGLTGLPGALMAVAAYVWEKKAPTVYYSHKDYYKKKPNYSTKQVWQFYKDSK